jgi:hypothetical protein
VKYLARSAELSVPARRKPALLEPLGLRRQIGDADGAAGAYSTRRTGATRLQRSSGPWSLTVGTFPAERTGDRLRARLRLDAMA